MVGAFAFASGRADARVGERVVTTIDHASLFQCPATFCNQGEVPYGLPSGHPSRISYLCTMIHGSPSPWGRQWTLVISRANNHVGFLDAGFISPVKRMLGPRACENIGQGVYAMRSGVPLFQCPATSCNRGVIVQGVRYNDSPSWRDDVAAICQMIWGRRLWTLVLNHENNHVGFIYNEPLQSQKGRLTVKMCP